MKSSILLSTSLLLIALPRAISTIRNNPNTITLPLLPYHVVAKRHLESSLPDEKNLQQVIPLYQGYGTHYLDLSVGSPPQRQTVIVDTGSQLTAFPCSGCLECGDTNYHIDASYKYESSFTFEKLKCEECQQGTCKKKFNFEKGDENDACKMSLSYQEGSSWTAFEARDLVYVGGLHDRSVENDSGDEDATESRDPYNANRYSFPLTFGCQTTVSGLFRTQLADGILGMSDEPGSLPNQILGTGLIDNSDFSLCYIRQGSVDRKGTLAGAITLGGYDEKLHKKAMVMSKNVKKNGYFTVRLRKIMLRAQTQNNITEGEIVARDENGFITVKLDVSEREMNGGGVIIDSGTTSTHFSEILDKPFQNVYQQFVGNIYHNELQKITEEDVRKLPTILIQMEGANDGIFTLDDAKTMTGLAGDLDPTNPFDVIVVIPPEHYMSYDASNKQWVSQFYTNEPYGGGSVLGANIMQGHDIFFDVTNGKIGWAESDCDYEELINTNEEFTNEIVEGHENDTNINEEVINTNVTPNERVEEYENGTNIQLLALETDEKSCYSLKCQLITSAFFMRVLMLTIIALTVITWIYCSPKNTRESARYDILDINNSQDIL